MKFIDKVKGVFMKMGADTKAAREFRDIFELDGVPPFREFYNDGILIWKRLYRGFYDKWHMIGAPTVADPSNKRQMYRMNLSKAVCAELAGLIWSEQCRVNVNLTGFTPTENEPEDKAQRFIDSVLSGNNFGVKMQESIEQMLALGGLTLKVWHDSDKGVKLGYAMATSLSRCRGTTHVFLTACLFRGRQRTVFILHGLNGTGSAARRTR